MTSSTSPASPASPASAPATAARAGILPLLYLGMLGAIQGADPNIASTALLSASSALRMGTLDAIAASINTLMLAATVITTGMMADRWGRRKVLLAALVLSIVGDVLVATAVDPYVYVIGRGVAGIGLGAVFGASFAYIRTFAKPGAGGLASALGVYAAATGACVLVFTFTGSALVGIDWRVAFLFTPAMCALAIVLGLLLLPSDGARQRTQAPWDAIGQLLLGLGIVLSLYGISHASNGLTEPLTVGPFVAGVVLLALFAWRESTEPDKRFFPIGLFRHPVFLAAVLAGLLYNLTSGVTLLAFSNLFQYSFDVKGIALSLSQLPYLVVGVPVALLAGKLLSSGKLSRRGLLMLGTGLIAVGAVGFGLIALARPGSILAFIPALLVIGAGVIIPSVPYGSMILGEATPEHYGVVSSSRTTIGQYWYSLGLAGATLILDAVTRGLLGSRLGPDAVTQLNAYEATGAQPTTDGVLQTASHVYVDAFAALMFILAAVIVVAGGAIWVLLRRRA